MTLSVHALRFRLSLFGSPSLPWHCLSRLAFARWWPIWSETTNHRSSHQPPATSHQPPGPTNRCRGDCLVAVDRWRREADACTLYVTTISFWGARAYHGDVGGAALPRVQLRSSCAGIVGGHQARLWRFFLFPISLLLLPLPDRYRAAELKTPACITLSVIWLPILCAGVAFRLNLAMCRPLLPRRELDPKRSN